MGRYTAHLVGESNYQPAVKGLRVGDRIELVPEPANRYDPRAIRADGPGGKTVGYIERDSWLTRVIVDERGTVSARVQELIGGERGKPSVGVVLEVRTAADAETEPAASSSAAPKATRAETVMPQEMTTKSKIAAGVVGVVVLLTLLGQCSPDAGKPGAPTATSEATSVTPNATATENAQALAAEKAKCTELIEGLTTGLIREREETRIIVEDANWAQVPYKDKVNVLIGAFCAQTGRQALREDDKMSAYAYRSGDRLMTITESGVF